MNSGKVDITLLQPGCMKHPSIPSCSEVINNRPCIPSLSSVQLATRQLTPTLHPQSLLLLCLSPCHPHLDCHCLEGAVMCCCDPLRTAVKVHAHVGRPPQLHCCSEQPLTDCLQLIFCCHKVLEVVVQSHTRQSTLRATRRGASTQSDNQHISSRQAEHWLVSACS